MEMETYTLMCRVPRPNNHSEMLEEELEAQIKNRNLC